MRRYSINLDKVESIVHSPYWKKDEYTELSISFWRQQTITVIVWVKDCEAIMALSFESKLVLEEIEWNWVYSLITF